MAEEVVVKESLTREMVDAGAELVRWLDKAKLTIRAALWLYIPELNAWRFMVALPEVKSEGPSSVYRRIQKIIDRMPSDKPKVDIRDVSVVEPEHPFISVLRAAVRTDQGMTGIRFSRDVINGMFVEDAYIYRSV